MSENTTDTAGAVEAAKPAPPAEPDWKAEARKWEARAKENSEAAKRLASIEDAAKSDLDKANERAAAAESARMKAESENTRLSVLAEFQIPPDYQGLVKGSDESEIRDTATKVAALIATRTDPNVTSRVVVTGEGTSAPLALNGDGLEQAIRTKLNLP